MIDRARLDQSVAEAATANGADLRTETRLLALDTAARRARLKGPNGEYTVEARLIVGADGPHSAVAKAAGLPSQATVHTRQHSLPLRAPHTDTDIYLSSRFPGGYGWFFPRGEVANVGLGIDRRFGDDLGTPLQDLIDQLVAEGWVRDELLGRTGGSIPVGGLRPLVHPGPVLLVGDAGGLTHPITGAGIPAALVTGERAGEAAVESLAGGDGEALAAGAATAPGARGRLEPPRGGAGPAAPPRLDRVFGILCRRPGARTGLARPGSSPQVAKIGYQEEPMSEATATPVTGPVFTPGIQPAVSEPETRYQPRPARPM